jgi:hypothetical protein
MEYVVFLGLKRVGSIYPNIDEAKKVITTSGIWNVCAVDSVDGKLKIITRQTITR